MRYRIIDEPEVPEHPPWDPRAIFWSALLSGLLCPLAWIGGMVCYALNWARLHQPQGRSLAWSLLIIGVFVQAHLVYFLSSGAVGLAVGRQPSLARDLARQALSLVPMALLLHQVWAQQSTFAAYDRRGAPRARAAPLALNFAALVIGWQLLVGSWIR